MEVVLKFSPTTLSLQKCAKSYKKVPKKCDFFSCKNLVLNPHFRKKKQLGIINVTVFTTKNWFCKNQSSRVEKIIDIVKVKGRMQLFSSSSVRHIKSTSPNQISSKLDEFYGSYGHFRLSLQKNVPKKWELCKKIWAPIFFLISRVQWTNPEIFRAVWKNSLFLPLELGLSFIRL